MKEKYTFQVEANLGNAIPSVGKVLNDINKTMSGFGFREGKLTARTVILSGTITVHRKLSRDELSKMRNTIEEKYKEQLPDWEISITPLEHF